MQFANPEIADEVVACRARESDADYVTYCAMCRDNFAAGGKRSVHVLELLCGSAADPAARPAPTFSQRQDRRAALRASLLADLWGEPAPAPRRPASEVVLLVAPEVAARLQRRMILEEDVREVIAHAEATGDRMEDAAGHVFACLRPANVTFWVEYSRASGGYAVHNAYSHRMNVRSAGATKAGPGGIE
jgi:hypothetical protein